MLTRNVSPTTLTPMQQRVAREIVALVRRRGQRAGAHLTEVNLASQLGTSRSPVRAALRYLTECGVLGRDASHGLALTKDAAEWTAVAERFASRPDDSFYLRIAEDRQRGLLPDVTSESDLMRRYDVARTTLRKVLARISEEGWIEQRVGRGWCFLPMIDSPDAYAESQVFRQSVEPSGLLSPSFQIVPTELAELRGEQRRIADCEGRGMAAIELFDANCRFHEGLARWSNNRFLLQSVRRVNSLRRLVDYRLVSQGDTAYTAALEHLHILQAVEAFDLVTAAALLRSHLHGVTGDRTEHVLFR